MYTVLYTVGQYDSLWKKCHHRDWNCISNNDKESNIYILFRIRNRSIECVLLEAPRCDTSKLFFRIPIVGESLLVYQEEKAFVNFNRIEINIYRWQTTIILIALQKFRYRVEVSCYRISI